MASNSDIVGSAFINGTSYTGCDIKVVIHIPGTGQNQQNERIALNDEIEKIQGMIDLNESEISAQEVKLSSSKPGTPEFYLRSGKRSSLVANSYSLQQSLQAAQDEIRVIEVLTAPLSTKVLAECQSISLSVYRDKQSVRALGTVYPRGITRGPREIAGTIVFTVFNEHVLYEFLGAHPTDFDAVQYTTAILDQLPPVDITIAFANEYGQVSRMAIYGVEFFTEAQIMSIEDLLTENTINYIARDYDPMRSVGARKIDDVSNRLQATMMKKASDLIYEEDYQRYKSEIDPFAGISPYGRFKRRRNPFL